MPRVLEIILGLTALVLIAAAVMAIRFLTNAGVFTEAAEVGAGLCRPIGAPAGAEDIAIDRETGWLYVSATDRRAVAAGDTGLRGDLYAFRPDDPDNGLTPLTGEAPPAFRPHGISFWAAPDGSEKRLFAISHPNEDLHTVEIFRIGPNGRLAHLETVADPLIRTPNDLVAVGPRQFYVTNDHRYGFGADLLRGVEDVLRLNGTDVVYFDGTTGTIAADGLTYANGININADGSELYVTETTDGILRIYDRDTETGALALRPVDHGRLWVGPGPDNIAVAEDGTLWITSHPNLLKFLQHAQDPAAPSPTRVLTVALDPDKGAHTVETVYLTHGSDLSGGSVAVPAGDRFVVGSVFEDKILICGRPGGGAGR